MGEMLSSASAGLKSLREVNAHCVPDIPATEASESTPTRVAALTGMQPSHSHDQHQHCSLSVKCAGPLVDIQ